MKNKYEIRGDVTVIFVKQKLVVYEFLIDTEDLVKVSQFNTTWHRNTSLDNFIYAMTKPQTNFVRSNVLMHRLIMDCPDDKFVDHINHDTLDNRKVNLRIVTKGENTRNLKGARSDNSSTGYRGITKNTDGMFKLDVSVSNKRYHLGTYKDLEQAKNIMDEVHSLVESYGDNFNEELLKPYLPDKEVPYRNYKNKARNVYWDERYQHWFVKVYHNKKSFYFGSYKILEEAVTAATEARKHKHLLI
jgi:hypothetical protein